MAWPKMYVPIFDRNLPERFALRIQPMDRRPMAYHCYYCKKRIPDGILSIIAYWDQPMMQQIRII